MLLTWKLVYELCRNILVSLSGTCVSLALQDARVLRCRTRYMQSLNIAGVGDRLEWCDSLQDSRFYPLHMTFTCDYLD